MSHMFEAYAGFVTRCSAAIFLIALLVIALLASGNRYEEKYYFDDFALMPRVSIT